MDMGPFISTQPNPTHKLSNRTQPETSSTLTQPKLPNPMYGVKGKASSLDIAPLTILNSGALQPRKWQLTGNDCSTATQAVAAQSLR